MRVNVYWLNNGVSNHRDNLPLPAALLIAEAVLVSGGEVTGIIDVKDD